MKQKNSNEVCDDCQTTATDGRSSFMGRLTCQIYIEHDLLLLWSKNSYLTSYSVLTGVAAIEGQHTV